MRNVELLEDYSRFRRLRRVSDALYLGALAYIQHQNTNVDGKLRFQCGHESIRMPCLQDRSTSAVVGCWERGGAVVERSARQGQTMHVSQQIQDPEPTAKYGLGCLVQVSCIRLRPPALRVEPAQQPTEATRT